MLATTISPAQQGFLPGRSLLHNLVEVDGEMRVASLLQEGEASVFVGFAAAIPSLALEFLVDVVTHMALPRGFREFLALRIIGQPLCGQRLQDIGWRHDSPRLRNPGGCPTRMSSIPPPGRPLRRPPFTTAFSRAYWRSHPSVRGRCGPSIPRHLRLRRRLRTALPRVCS